MAEIVTGYLLDEEPVSKEEREVVEYGIESLINNLLGIIITIAVGLFMDCVAESILVWLCLFSLRKNAGGFHAKTKTRCLIMSVVIFVVAFQFVLKADWTMHVYTIVMIVGAVVIACLAPVETQNKRLDKKEMEVYGKRTRKLLLLQLMVYLTALFLEAWWLCRILTTVITIVGFSVVLGKVRLYLL